MEIKEFHTEGTDLRHRDREEVSEIFSVHSVVPISVLIARRGDLCWRATLELKPCKGPGRGCLLHPYHAGRHGSPIAPPGIDLDDLPLGKRGSGSYPQASFRQVNGLRAMCAWGVFSIQQQLEGNFRRHAR